MEEALAVAEKIAGYSLPAVLMIKESINRAYETSLAEGVLFERRLFHSQFALEAPLGKAERDGSIDPNSDETPTVR